MKFVYFGHSRFTYGTKEEKKAVEIIRKKFPDYRILNPNKKKHQDNCSNYYSGVAGTEMEYFLNLTKMCEFGIFMVYDENKWSPGSYTEATKMIMDGKKVYLLNPSNWEIKRITKINDHYSFNEENERLQDV